MTNSIGQILLYESLGLSYLLEDKKPKMKVKPPMKSGKKLTEAIRYSIEEGIKRDIRLQKGLEKRFTRMFSKPEPAQIELATGSFSPKVYRARQAGLDKARTLAARAEKRAGRYVGRIDDIQIGGKKGRTIAGKIETHNPGQTATKTLSDKALGEIERAENIKKRFNV